MSKRHKPNDDVIEVLSPFESAGVAAYVPRSQKNELIKSGRARSIDHGKRLRLTNPYDSLLSDERRTYKQTIPIAPRTLDDSGRMGERVMIANADEEGWARELTAAWRANQVGLDSDRGIALSNEITNG